MKKISILTILAAMLTFSSCEEDPILGCTDPTAINYNELATANVAYMQMMVFVFIVILARLLMFGLQILVWLKSC